VERAPFDLPQRPPYNARLLRTVVFEERRNTLAFCLAAHSSPGCRASPADVPDGRDTVYILAGMPMDTGCCWHGCHRGRGRSRLRLLPTSAGRGAACADARRDRAARECAADGRDWRVARLLTLALVIDIMKPASLGFVTPGMRME